jgi:GntR family transcriptional repressor for pyruvate dehydrogenase complex
LDIGAVFSSLGAPRVYHHIVAHIERAIYDGRLVSGDKLPPEREMGRRFGASRVAVREALKALEHRGLLEVRQGSCGGHFVRAVDASVVSRDFGALLRLGRLTGSHLGEARLIMEPEVARLAAERATDRDIKELRAALDDRYAATIQGRDPRTLDLDFHRRLAAAGGNPVHAVAVHALIDLESEMMGSLTGDAARDEIARAHVAILAAVEARDGAQARAIMEHHIVDVQRRRAHRSAGIRPGEG